MPIRGRPRTEYEELQREKLKGSLLTSALATVGALGLAASPLGGFLSPAMLLGLGIIPGMSFAKLTKDLSLGELLGLERRVESKRRGGKEVHGLPPHRDCFAEALEDAKRRGKSMLDKYLVGFDLESGEPLWVSDDDICTHAGVFAKTGVGKTLWVESLMFQQMARGRASGCTFIDAKRDSGTLAHVILMALVTGRIEDLIVIDPFDPVHAYNFVLCAPKLYLRSL